MNTDEPEVSVKVQGNDETAKKHRAPVRKMIFLTLFAVIFITGGIFAGIYILRGSEIYGNCTAEAGVAVTAEDFMKTSDRNVAFTEKSDLIDPAVPGNYQLYIKNGIFSYRAQLTVTDSVAPLAESVRVEICYGEECEPEDFVTNIVDETAVTVSFFNEPDMTQGGNQEVDIILTDLGGNQTFVSSQLYISMAVKELFIESGDRIPSSANFKIAGEDVSFAQEYRNLSTDLVTDYEIFLCIDDEIYESVLHIQDTTAPELSLTNRVGYKGCTYEPEYFLNEVSDVTKVTLEFDEEPDPWNIGNQVVTVRATDEGGNVTSADAVLMIVDDNEPPVITGVLDITYVMGDAIAYRQNVSATDNSGSEIEVVVDSSEVNLDEEGTYTVVYTAADPAGNETSCSAEVTVYDTTYSIDEVYAMADAVLGEILTDEMTDLEKVRAIYDYVTSNVSFISYSEKGDWIRAAYEGFTLKRGDCFVYASITQALLNRAGITNMMIEKIPSYSRHYWNLVDLGDGWYHLDTSPRKDHPVIFMWTDEELMAYSNSHNGTHNYDHELYPNIN